MPSEYVYYQHCDLRIKKRVRSLKTSFPKHAEVCGYCHSLNIWTLQKHESNSCHRCGKALK